MANTFELISAVTVPSPQSSITFTSISSAFTDLKLVISARSDRAASTWDYINVAVNGSSTNYSYRYISGNGAAAASGSLTLLYGGDFEASSATSATFSNTEIYFPNYTSTTTAKSMSFDTSAENNATTAYLYLGAGLWNPATQAAISSITLTTGNAANFVAASSAYLYGIKNS
jgi:hypothetical protein